MTPDELAIAAQDAIQLKSNPAFERAWKDLRLTAVEALVTTDPTDVETIRTRQAEIKALDGLAQQLINAINRAPRKPLAVA